MIKYSVIIPVYNEEGSLVALCRRVKEVMERLNESYEVVFVDDASSDGSLQKLRDAQKSSEELVIVVLSGHTGKSEALQAGFDTAAGQIYITMDGDGQDDPRDIVRLLNKMDEGYDLVYGWRYRMEGPFGKKLVSKTANIIRRLITGEDVHDVGCPLRAFRKESLAGVCLSGGLHRFFSTIMKRGGAA